MSAESPRHVRLGGPVTVPPQPPSDRSIIDAVSGFINDITLSSSSSVDPKDVIQWARFETADINEPTPEGDSDNDISPLLLILGYGSGVQVWLVPPSGEAQEVLSWRQGTVRVLRILPTPRHGDCFASKRPLIALCDSASTGPAFCSLSFISIRSGEQVKSIKFKNPILDVLANKTSVVISFTERFAIFDAATLEDGMVVTTCYPCPCPLGGPMPVNPIALGDRWLAFADKKLIQSKRSSGGCEEEGVTSYTATVLHAAKSLSKGLRGLGESVAHSLGGARTASQSPSPPHSDSLQPGVVTILDIEGNDEEEEGQEGDEQSDPTVVHFVAHSDAIIALKFDPSGMLLVTADRRGHDFHVFRVNPHPCGPALASVHHLYILHRGDTTARVQDIAISNDSRWAAISTLRGTTHVFAMSPCGGACGVRTHTQFRVVNRLSRFHRSAGLPIHADRTSRSPVNEGAGQGAWFPNPRQPPYPQPTVAAPMAQLRPTAKLPTHTITRTSSGRQRLSSLSEESAAPLLARAQFGAAGAAPSPCPSPGAPPRPRSPVAALYLMAANGELLQLYLHPKPASSVPKDKISDESPIQLEVEPVCVWPLSRPPADLLAPLPPSNPLLHTRQRKSVDLGMSEAERWLSQVEIVTHAGPHRRLWMGPQFVFKTYNSTGSNSSLSEAETVEVDTSITRGVARSNPVNMPARSAVPVLIDSGSASSLEPSPSDSFRRKSLLSESGRAPVCDVQLREDLAEAMKEDQGWCPVDRSPERESRGAGAGAGVGRAVGPLGTVVLATRSPSPPAREEPTHHDNRDEATFRPVVRAHANIPQHPLAYPLPHSTIIPVDTSTPISVDSPTDPRHLTTTVVIPAQLSSSPLTDSELAELSLPKSNRLSDSPTARSRVKKSPTPFDSEKIVVSPSKSSSRESPRVVVLPRIMEAHQPQIDIKISKSDNDREVELSYDLSKKCNVSNIIEPSDFEEIEVLPETQLAIGSIPKGTTPSTSAKGSKKEIDIKDTAIQKEVSTTVTKKSDMKKESEKEAIKHRDEKLKSEEQAWDMLLNEPEKPTIISEQAIKTAIKDESKSKSKKKLKKCQDNAQSKSEDDSFVEIHAIEEKQESNSDELVSISTHFEEKASSPLPSKTKKTRLVRSLTPEKMEDVKRNPRPRYDSEPNFLKLVEKEEQPFEFFFEEVMHVPDISETTKELKVELVEAAVTVDTPKAELIYETSSDKSHSVVKPLRKGKSKSLSPNIGKSADVLIEPEIKDLYFINTTTQDFPDIQITTKPSKLRKKSPQPVEKKVVESQDVKKIPQSLEEKVIERQDVKKSPQVVEKMVVERQDIKKSPQPFEKKVVESQDIKKPPQPVEKKVVERQDIKKSPQPFEKKVVESQEIKMVTKKSKSWSSVAATKTDKKEEEVKDESERRVEDIDDKVALGEVQNISSTKEVSLHDKLVEIYNRTDIIVAQCDTPLELKFVEEHLSVDWKKELTMVEEIECGLKDFKLDDMSDSLLEVDDPPSSICKVKKEDTLSPLTEATSKANESSSFSLIDLEKVPPLIEKGFSVVESDKITTQEVKLDDDKGEGVMQKLSDDVAVKESDKGDKKSTGASVETMPSTKQLSKSKKSRRKKK